MYDHITRGWFAIELTVMGSMSVGFVLALFMLGERPLGLRLFQRQKKVTLGEQTPKEKHPGKGGNSHYIDLIPFPDFGNDAGRLAPGFGVATNLGSAL